MPRLKELGCEGKTKYPNRKSAYRAMYALINDKPNFYSQRFMHVYKCPWCRTWHYGHASNRRKR